MCVLDVFKQPRELPYAKLNVCISRCTPGNTLKFQGVGWRKRVILPAKRGPNSWNGVCWFLVWIGLPVTNPWPPVTTCEFATKKHYLREPGRDRPWQAMTPPIPNRLVLQSLITADFGLVAGYIVKVLAMGAVEEDLLKAGVNQKQTVWTVLNYLNSHLAFW